MAQIADNLSTHLKRWSSQLDETSDSARLDAEILLKHVSGMDDTQLIIRDTEPLDEQTVSRVEALIEARRQGSPIAYLTGRREFYALNLMVNRHVLIPRPETELLVDTALALIGKIETPRILDMGTGSGAIALAIASNAPTARVLATDIDENALYLAAQNARHLCLHNVEFLPGDWYTGLPDERFDLIISNPPYIDPDDPHLQQGNVQFEPQHALVASDRGLADIIKIIDQAHAHLEPGGSLALEHGYDQGDAVRKLLQASGFTDIETLKDLNQHDRITMGNYPLDGVRS